MKKDVARDLLRYVPSDPAANVRWRLKVRKLALLDKNIRSVLRAACWHDPLFFFQSSLWLYEPRSTVSIRPFALWPHQIPAILTLDSSITSSGRNMDELIDLVFDKSRAQGASFICLGVLLRRWLRDRMFAAGMVSRNMDAGDNTDDPNSLGWKLDFLIKTLPFWMRPRGWNPKEHRLISKHSWTNPRNGSTIIIYPATGDVARGGRKSLFGPFDEIAEYEHEQAQEAIDSTQHVTNCRWFVSTHKGDTGPYYEMVYGDQWVPESGVMSMGGSGVYHNNAGGVLIRLSWEDNPLQNKLAYRVTRGLVFAERPEEDGAVREYVKRIRNSGAYDKLVRRGFMKDGRLRSPWYDRRCLQKGATPRSIAQELDRDPRGTVGKMFNTAVLDRMRREFVRPPVWEGEAAIVDGQLRLSECEGGPLKLWFKPGLNDTSPASSYCLGADIGTGAGADEWSNSALVGVDQSSGDQVLEYADSRISETHFARLSVVLCRWLHRAMLIWEVNGPTGRRFGDEVRDIGYDNLWHRETKETKVKEKTRQIGWVNNQFTGKKDLFDDFWVGMDDGVFIPRSEDLIRDCAGWEYDENGKPIFRGQGHGDRAIAGGLCRKALKDFSDSDLDKETQMEENPPWGTLAWRIQDRKRQNDHKSDPEGIGFGVKELLSM